MHRVALVRCDEYSEAELGRAIDEALGLLGGLERFLPLGSDAKVLLKPNLLFDAPPERVITTNPLFCSVVAQKVKQITSVIPDIGDSPAGMVSDFESLIGNTGLKRYADAGQFHCVNFANDGITNVEVENGRRFKTIPVSNTCLNADVIINLPKLKTHSLMHMTGAVKNLFGAALGFYKTECHKVAPHSSDLAEVFIHYANIVKPRLTIMDAVVAMDGNGPGSGDPFAMRAIIAGENPFAVDVVASMLINRQPESIPILKMAKEFGVDVPLPGSDRDEGRLEIVGESIDSFDTAEFRVPGTVKFDLVPELILRCVGSFLTIYPRIINDMCIGCYRCVDGCPTEALIVPGDRKAMLPPILSKKKCISCFCCQEICPKKAIMFQYSWLARLFFGKSNKSNE